MEAEARETLSQLVQPSFKGVETDEEEDFGTAIRKLFAPLDGVELQIPPRRKSHRPIPTFD
jgi:hypothetical protein